MKAMISLNGLVAIEPIAAAKIETDTTGGFATIKQKRNLIASTLVMDYVMGEDVFGAGEARALLKGDSAFSSWAKEVFEHDGVKFVLAPLSAVVGFEENE